MPNAESMSLNRANPDADGSPPVEFCALEYRPQDREVASFGVAPVIVLVLKGREGGLHILVHPDLRTIVRRKDLAFLESLLQDFTERARMHPAALFKHLSSLGAGPLVTHLVGANLSETPSIKELFSRFVLL